MFLVLQMSMAIMSGLFFFYVDFYITKDATYLYEDTMVGLIAAALMFSMQIVALPIYLKMIASKGKTYTYRFGSFVWIITGILLFLIPANANPIYIYLLGAAMGFGISAPGLVPHTMFGDVVDAGQLKFKDRLDGQMSGFANFMSKVAQAVGLALVMAIIGFAGFESQDLTQATINEQSDSAMLAIRIIMSLAPLVLMGIGSFISTRYKINKTTQEAITKAIESDDESVKKQLLESL